jgi:hypothetical protein
MPVTGPPNAEKITAAQFNELVALYDAYWQGETYSYTDSIVTETYTGGDGSAGQTYTIQQPLGAPAGWFIKKVMLLKVNGFLKELQTQHNEYETNGQIITFTDSYGNIPSAGDIVTITIANSHNTEIARQKGWGQPAVIPTVAQTTIITAEHTNYLIAQINAGLWHMEESLASLQVPRSSSTSISATLYNQLENVYNNVIEPNKFNIDPSSKNVNTSIVTTSNSGTPWQADLYSEHKFAFTSYSEARHFFNSGGELLVDMSSTAGGTNTPSLVWNDFFDNIGVVRIGALTTTNDGDGEGDAPFSSLGGSKGFWHMSGFDNGSNPTGDDWVTVYNVAADGGTGNGSYGGGSEAGEYGSGYSSPGGIYSQRRFIMDLRGTVNPTTNNFEIHLKIKLIEDDDDDSFINTDIIGEFGYAQPLETPDTADISGNSLATYFSPATGVDYVFLERAAPIISQVTPWTAVNYLTVTITGV